MDRKLCPQLLAHSRSSLHITTSVSLFLLMNNSNDRSMVVTLGMSPQFKRTRFLNEILPQSLYLVVWVRNHGNSTQCHPMYYWLDQCWTPGLSWVNQILSPRNVKLLCSSVNAGIEGLINLKQRKSLLLSYLQKLSEKIDVQDDNNESDRGAKKVEWERVAYMPITFLIPGFFCAGSLWVLKETPESIL